MNEKKKVKAKALIAITAIIIAITAGAAISVAVASPPTIYYIYGYVFYQNTTTCGPGDPCNDPTVIITNTNTSEDWTAETASHAYQLTLLAGSGWDVEANNILKFNATSPDGKYQNVTCHTVTQAEMGIEGGGLFDFNLTLHKCGDVNCDDLVDVDDIIKLERKVSLLEPLDCDWAGDANCDDLVDVDDIIKLERKVSLLEALNCCG